MAVGVVGFFLEAQFNLDSLAAERASESQSNLKNLKLHSEERRIGGFRDCQNFELCTQKHGDAAL